MRAGAAGWVERCLFSFDAESSFAELGGGTVGGCGTEKGLKPGSSVELEGGVEDTFVADFDYADEVGAKLVDIEVEEGEAIFRKRCVVEVGDDTLSVYEIDDLTGLVIDVETEADFPQGIHDTAEQSCCGAVVAEFDVECELGEISGDVDGIGTTDGELVAEGAGDMADDACIPKTRHCGLAPLVFLFSVER